MEVRLLANELRAKQRELGAAPAHIIDSLSDHQIIDAYITCSCCDDKLLEDSELEYAIAAADNVDHFFEIAEKFGRAKHLVGLTEGE